MYTPNFVDLAANNLQTSFLVACGIPLELTNVSHWSPVQRTCYYDILLTGDIAFGISSRQAAQEQLENRESLLNPPTFNSNLSLKREVQAGEQVNLSFEATSEFSSIIAYKLLNGPNGSIFNEQSGQFQWQVPFETENGTEIPVKVSATDETKNLTSSYEVSLVVATTMITNVSSTLSSPITSTTSSMTTQITSIAITSGSIISIVLNSLSPKFRRIGSNSANHYYHVVPITIAQPGIYTFTSNSTIATHGFIYMNNFDAENPNSSVLAQDNGTENNGQYKLSASLQATSPVLKCFFLHK